MAFWRESPFHPNYKKSTVRKCLSEYESARFVSGGGSREREGEFGSRQEYVAYRHRIFAKTKDKGY
jgi:hypothetical protein